MLTILLSLSHLIEWRKLLTKEEAAVLGSHFDTNKVYFAARLDRPAARLAGP